MHPTAPTAGPARGRVLLAVAAGIAVAVAVAAAGGGETTALSASAGDGLGAMCAEVTAEGLSSATLAFRGTVTAVDGGTVALRVDEVFAGEVGPTATIAQGDADDVVDGAAPAFEEGIAYLVSAADDVVRSCGLTSTDSPELTALYEEAFRR